MEDPVAIRRCRAGDKDAFRYIVERYQAEAVGHAIAILADREDALDAVQEAFIDAYQALGRFDSARRFYPWFYVILRNCCYKLATNRRKHEASSLDGREILASTSGISSEDAILLERSLLELSAEDRELITLRHLDGLSYRELAERLELPEGTVMSRLYYARKQLRQKLARHSFTGL
jgi:RNA polymerase sigma-70 factor (ECF subfamily)